MPTVAVFAFIALPWVNPFSPGPMAAAVPLMFSWACAAALMLVVAPQAHAWQGDRLLRVAAGAWLAAALVSVVMGLLQYFGATEVFGDWVNRSSRLGEAYANLRQRNQFASLTSLGLLALLWWAAQEAVAPERTKNTALASGATRVAPLVAAVLLGVGNAASASRTGLMQLVLIALLTLLWGGLRHTAVRRVLLLSMLAYALALVALPWLADLDPSASGAWARLRAGDSECASRLTLWRNVLHLIAQKPWTGWGWGELDYAHFITLYPGARFCDILDNAHNLPLHLAVELGVPVAVLLCGAALLAVWRAQPWRETHATRQLAWGVLAVLLLHSALEYPLWYGPFQMAVGLCVWFLWRRRTPPPPRNVGLLVGLMAGACLTLGSYAAWDYHRISQIYLSPAQRSAAYRENTLLKLQSSVLFSQPVRFAELAATPLTPANAAHLHPLALALLHFSPEPRVVEKLIESAELLGHADEAQFYRARFEAAFTRK